MRVAVIAGVIVVASMHAAAASVLGDTIAKEVCHATAVGYDLKANEISTYDAQNVYGSFSYGGNTYWSFGHEIGNDAQCTETTNEGMFIRVCRRAVATRSGNRLTRTGSWTEYAC